VFAETLLRARGAGANIADLFGLPVEAIFALAPMTPLSEEISRGASRDPITTFSMSPAAGPANLRGAITEVGQGGSRASWIFQVPLWR
jgi:hypothetical protein